MGCPDDLKYTKEHEWVKVDGDSATVGITHFAQSELGDLVFVDLPEIGKTVKQKDSFCVVESTKAASDVYAPIGGTVKEVNVALTESPEIINTDSYGAGWLVRLEGISKGDLDGLLSPQQYRELIGE